jgi:uncharacterized protein
MKKIVLAGGAGYLGRALARYFLKEGFEVVTLARKKFETVAGERFVQWDGVSRGDWCLELEESTALINLAGRTVNCRYTMENRSEMMDSRVKSTRTLGQAVLACVVPPAIWMNSSTATIYRHSIDREQTEAAGEIGKGFSVEIAKAWEKEFFEHSRLGVRQIALRSAMVFGPGETGVYEAFRTIVRQGLGGRAGVGNQYVSWIHLDDFVGMVRWLLDHADLEGVFNIASPEPKPNEIFMRNLRDSIGVRFGLNAPEWLLEIGAIFKGTETELLLKSRRVVPERILQSGYQMKFQNLEGALSDLAAKRLL